ncbi:MAG: transcriptional regulator [Candidatus Thermoplasmatota archaeon]
MLNRNELVQNVRDTLVSAGFYVSDLVSMRPVGFDLVARRDNQLLIIKVLTNIDALSEEIADELIRLSFLLKASPMIIGERKGTGKLEQNVVYDRFGIKSISKETLKDHLLEGIPLHVYAAPGGLYVNLDHEKILRLRKEKEMSLGNLARRLKVSRKTIQKYEEGMNARVEVALRIEEMMDDGVTEPIEILNQYYKKLKEEVPDVSEKEKQKIKNYLQKEIFSILKELGYQVVPLTRCPFEAVSKVKKNTLLTCIHKYDKKLLKKAKIVKSISKITEKHALLVTDKDVDKKNISGTPLFIKKELKKIRSPEEIFEILSERL